jgi:protein TonB
MGPTLRTPGLATSAAARWTVAVAGSLALHATAALVLAGIPLGSPTGEGPLSSQPLNARILAASPEPIVATPPPASVAAAPKQPAPAHSPGADAPQPFGLREPVYYAPAELDVRPRLTTRVDPAYPRVAPPDGGYLVLRLLIGEDGRVERTIVVLADPEGYFEEAATEAFAGAVFAPGRRGGVAVKSQIWVELKFRPLVPPEPAPPGTEATR